MGLPKQHRLKDRLDFQAVYERGKAYRGRYLVLKVLSVPPPIWQGKPPLPLPTLIGIAVGKKVSKKAVRRNRIKRQIRAILQPLLPRLSPGLKLIVIVKPSGNQCEYEHFLRELKELLLGAKVLHGH
ncbi:ribonuclease P protein component [Spirulina subsalsa FACHB-351]|uniref:Ribonuclease P protein component n=1 Tax=Spirulina subsalsa FACHB-351 TaxID=234711 RepID=A0ABT3L7B1_9CYAN|nr:ribonuclease P protein component [Spirulina subsalsa]MCW6037411.1 ribonuclease P protein component [Spirulina subsalsa FACHB-351]